MPGRLDAPTIVLHATDPAVNAAAYRVLFGSPPAGDALGSDTPFELTLGGATVRVQSGTAPSAGGTAASRTVDRLQFDTVDLPAAERLLARRGVPIDISERGDLVLGDHPALGVGSPTAHHEGGSPDAELTGIDHVVVAARSAQTATAVFGGLLGLDFRLRQQPFEGVDQLFFRSPSLVVEVVVSTQAVPDSEFEMWGVAWLSTDLDRTHRRLADAGVPTSEIRPGHQRGSRVLTVRDRSLLTRTLVIEKGSRS
ncbi:hypothetical protein GS4_33_00690 [Gordonia soli NBRC 108243]|uniref:Uncharacterized protein n=1 Tax=Gordonia soli NBRC 108243 TaxID=1223545 RepID=M0QPB9_9ACTN|nr:hypothetical protein GS4_33_00690 [Gordonia soli NBRC 108243]